MRRLMGRTVLDYAVIQRGIFVSTEQTGTGSAQSIPHDLGAVPRMVFVALTGGPATYTQPTITLGSHTATHIVVTVTADWRYRIIAFA